MAIIQSEGLISAYGYSGLSSLDVGSLDGKHPIYKANERVWKEISELYNGGEILRQNSPYYLPQRPGEPNDLYTIRLNKFTYTNLLAQGIGTLTDQLSTGELNLGNATSSFWTEFRQNTDISGTSEKDFISNIFREVLLYGRVFVHIDKTSSDVSPRSLLEERELGIRPYLTTYSAPQVYDWDTDKGKVKFVKVRQEVRYRESPFSSPVTKVMWTYITDKIVARYEAYIDREGNKDYVSLVDPTGKFVSEYNTDIVIEPTIIEHGYKECPVQMLALSSETWVSNLAIHKLREALQLENFIFDAISVGCHLQRTYKPYRDPDANKGSFIEPCDDNLALGNASVIKVDEYKIVEMQGTAVDVAARRLQAIQQEISVVITAKTLNYNQESYVASGNSKRIDFIEQQNSLVKYGQLLREFYQNLIDIVAGAYPSETRPYVHGYSSFQLDTVSEMLLLGQGLVTVAQYMPPLALKSFSERFSNLILDTDDPSVLAQLSKEINDMSFETPTVSLEPNNSLDPNLASVPKRKAFAVKQAIEQRTANIQPGESLA